jgi:hypothetical protein
MIATGKPANRADGNYRQTLQQVESSEGLASRNCLMPPPPGTLATLFVALSPVKNNLQNRKSQPLVGWFFC